MSTKRSFTIAGLATALMLGAMPARSANIVETAASAGQFTTLIEAAKAAGLAEALSTTNPITVFAPTDAAFAKLPKGTVETLLKPENRDQLRAILTYHVVPARVAAKGVPHQRTQVLTLNRAAKVTAVRSKGVVHVDKARVTRADIQTDNGIIHVINRVLIPGQAR